MALDTIMYPHDQIGIWGYDYLLQEDKTLCGILESDKLYQNHEILLASGLANNNNLDYCSSSSVMHNHNICDMKDHWGTNSSPEDCVGGGTRSDETTTMTTAKVAAVGRRKRRRTKSGKNKEELENQRMTHITVERNRRKQMNQYLAVIRSLMPSSYVQRVKLFLLITPFEIPMILTLITCN
ncbi:putative transcription factor bHLH family [Helianthus annuus]|nr:putative transcription factor bHLH family [Helianthus annuus]KAJ0541708.1 putative transcription factor bHLH family [Helianthus annuus]KAJ0706781.1 putative transcription factor bHLH family [Helianthus annuus]KAJ0710816.1 putative transcription factor bHLH family [Helianthus annuus]